MRSSARREPRTSSQWKAIAHWQRIDNLLCFWTIRSCWYTLLNIFNVSINGKTVRSLLARWSFFHNSERQTWSWIIWFYQLSWKCKLATVTSEKADISSVKRKIMDQFVFNCCKHLCERQDKEVSARYISHGRWRVVLLIVQHGDRSCSKVCGGQAPGSTKNSFEP